jgi:chromosome partitioning protein
MPTFYFQCSPISLAFFFLFDYSIAFTFEALEDKRVIIAITNQKGGVGKTTTALNISAALALMGNKILLVDTDPQAHSTISVLDDPTRFTKSLFDILMRSDDKFESIVANSTIPGLDIAISKISMAKLEPSLLGEIDGHYRLKDVLDPVRSKYNHIIIDTPPTLGLITLNSLVAATHILIPIQSSYLCLEGTDDLLETIDKVKKVANPDLKILGILITLHDKRTNISRDVVRRIRKVFGSLVFKTHISKSVKLEESPAYKESVFTYAPHSVGAVQYRKIAEEIIDRAKI